MTKARLNRWGNKEGWVSYYRVTTKQNSPWRFVEWGWAKTASGFQGIMAYNAGTGSMLMVQTIPMSMLDLPLGMGTQIMLITVPFTTLMVVIPTRFMIRGRKNNFMYGQEFSR